MWGIEIEGEIYEGGFETEADAWAFVRDRGLRDASRVVWVDEEEEGIPEETRKDNSWLYDTMRAVEELARRHGWDLDDSSGRVGWDRAATGSRYTTLKRSRVVAVDEDGYEEVEWQELKIRVSDHSTAYCSEDFSLCPCPGPDDHTLADLEQVLARPFEAD